MEGDIIAAPTALADVGEEVEFTSPSAPDVK